MSDVSHWLVCLHQLLITSEIPTISLSRRMRVQEPVAVTSRPGFIHLGIRVEV